MEWLKQHGAATCTGACTSGCLPYPSIHYMWVPDLGLALRVRPGMPQSSGADCSPPGISPCPLR
eukprot:714739-Prymnesium_polylepis.1